MRVAGILKNSVVNGVGIRDVIFLQGCEHFCKGCHNAHTWSKDGGKEMSIREIYNELMHSTNNVTISGGEPLLQNFGELVGLLTLLKRDGKSIWLYTGYKYEELSHHTTYFLHHYVDVLVDGRFEIDKKDLRLPFRGSSNQRLIDLPKSFESKEIVLWENER